MTITRDIAANYLHSQYSNLAHEVDQASPGADSGGYGPDIDNALRALGVAEADLPTHIVAETDRERYFANLDATAMRRFCNQMSPDEDVTLGPMRVSGESASASNVCKLANNYEAEAKRLNAAATAGATVGNKYRTTSKTVVEVF